MGCKMKRLVLANSVFLVLFFIHHQGGLKLRENCPKSAFLGSPWWFFSFLKMCRRVANFLTPLSTHGIMSKTTGNHQKFATARQIFFWPSKQRQYWQKMAKITYFKWKNRLKNYFWTLSGACMNWNFNVHQFSTNFDHILHIFREKMFNWFFTWY